MRYRYLFITPIFKLKKIGISKYDGPTISFFYNWCFILFKTFSVLMIIITFNPRIFSRYLPSNISLLFPFVSTWHFEPPVSIWTCLYSQLSRSEAILSQPVLIWYQFVLLCVYCIWLVRSISFLFGEAGYGFILSRRSFYCGLGVVTSQVGSFFFWKKGLADL